MDVILTSMHSVTYILGKPDRETKNKNNFNHAWQPLLLFYSREQILREVSGWKI